MLARFRAAAPAIGLLALLIALAVLAPRRPAAAEPAVWPAGPAPFGVSWVPRATYPASTQESHWSDPVRNRLYLGEGSNVRVMDAAGGETLGVIPLPVYRLFIDPAGDRLYATAYTAPGQIAVFDAETLAALAPLPYDCPPATEYCVPLDVAFGPGSRLYVARPYSATIDILDSASGAMLGSFTPDVAPNGGFGLEIIGDVLYLTGYQGDGLAAFDVSELEPVFLTAYALPSFASVMRADPNGSFLVVQVEGAIYQFSPDPLALTRVYAAPPPEVTFYNLNGIDEAGRILSIVHPIGAGEDPRIIAIDAATGGIARSLGAADATPAYDYLWDALVLGGGAIATFHNDSFIIRDPIDYAAALPVGFANACTGGPFIDTFDDPAGGWPSQVTETMITGYIPGAYRFYFSDPGQWAAVTRGDVWNNADLLEVTANLVGAQYGTFGLVYGINADWSDFYSFEILPYSQKWYLFHYHDGDWELIQSDYGDIFMPNQTWVALDRNVYTGEVMIEINGHAVTTVPDFTGRVGLTASSLYSNIESLFYEYRFHGDNCVKDGSKAETRYELRVLSDDSRRPTR